MKAVESESESGDSCMGQMPPNCEAVDQLPAQVDQKHSGELAGLVRLSDCSFDKRDFEELRPRLLKWSIIEDANLNGVSRGKP